MRNRDACIKEKTTEGAAIVTFDNAAALGQFRGLSTCSCGWEWLASQEIGPVERA
jgi:hypothetical protein